MIKITVQAAKFNAVEKSHPPGLGLCFTERVFTYVLCGKLFFTLNLFLQLHIFIQTTVSQ